MSISVGTQVKDFQLPDHKGGTRSLSEFLPLGPTVVFFYPKASSPICTKQACEFRDVGVEFRKLAEEKNWTAISRIGISKDPEKGQSGFASHHSLDYPLLCDTEGKVAALFGVKGGLGGLSPVQRSTFVLDQQGTVRAVIRHEFRGKAHAQEALSFLREWEA